MNTMLHCLTTVFLLAVFGALGQGTMIFDQQSAGEGASGYLVTTKPNHSFSFPPARYGQSFTPALSSVGFIRLVLGDASAQDGSTSIQVNLREGSVTGNILGSTELVHYPPGRSWATNLYFPSAVPVTPGQVYYFDLEIPMWITIPGGAQALSTPGVVMADFGEGPTFYDYPGGTAFYNGQAIPGHDLWFREGIIIPEPSGVLLVLVGGSMVILVIWQRKVGKGQARPPPLSP